MQIKPFLYYLGSIDSDREGDSYQCETVLTIELRLKYNNNTLWYVEIGTNVNFNIFLMCGSFEYSELKKPFKIRVYLYKKYSLLEPADEFEEDLKPAFVKEPFNYDQCVVCLSEKPEILFIPCLHRCICLKCEETSPFLKCPTCRRYIYIKVKI